MKVIGIFLLGACAFAADLSGNWLVAAPRNDGTFARTYFDIKPDGTTNKGEIHTPSAHYIITEVTGGADGFTLSATYTDNRNVRPLKYEGKVVGDELHITATGGRGTPREMVAHRVPEGEGLYPKKNPVPALHKVPYNGLAKTPPMGWNSWNKFGHSVDDAAVRGVADAIATNGMKDAGYVYINIDDTWEGDRDAKGNITSNKKFPDMKALADYVHSKGLKIGIYSSPGPATCAGYEGSYGHELQDAKTYASWGIDYLKYDWCSALNLYTNEEMQAVYQIMGDALRQAGRPIVFSLCQYGRNEVWKWGPEVGGNLWRTTGDISDRWNSMANIGFKQNDLALYAAPGHWNDPDMLEIGNGHMTDDEYRTHMSLWSMLAAPLLAGNDVRDMSQATKDILLNKEAIAIDQDTLGKQGTRLSQNGDQEIWVRELAGGAKAVALFNRGDKAAEMTVKWSDVGASAKPKVRDLWAHQDVNVEGGSYTATVPVHGVVLLRVK